MMATELDLIRNDCGACECGAETEIEPAPCWGGWLAVVTCPECGVIAEIELDARNEAAIRY